MTYAMLNLNTLAAASPTPLWQTLVMLGMSAIVGILIFSAVIPVMAGKLAKANVKFGLALQLAASYYVVSFLAGVGLLMNTGNNFYDQFQALVTAIGIGFVTCSLAVGFCIKSPTGKPIGLLKGIIITFVGLAVIAAIDLFVLFAQRVATSQHG